MKIAFYKKNGVAQGLDLYIANPDEEQELSDPNFLGYAEIETTRTAFNNWSSLEFHSVTFEPLVILRPLIIDYMQKKKAYYEYGYSKNCDPKELDRLNFALDDAEAILLKTIFELPIRQ
jgi:hypothetical protein